MVPKGGNAEKFMHKGTATLFCLFPLPAAKIFTENVCVASKKSDGIKYRIQWEVRNERFGRDMALERHRGS